MVPDNRRVARSCFLIFLAAFAARLLFFAWRGAQSGSDTFDYLQIAGNILRHFAFSLEAMPPFVPTIRRAPLYPAFLALLNGGSSSFLVVFMQSALDAFVAVLVLLMVRAVVPFRVALVAALFYAFHPGAIYAANSLLSEAVFTFILTCAVWLTAKALEHNRPRLAAAAGALFGLAIFCRPIAIVVAPLVAALVVFLPKLQRRRLHALALLGCMMLVLSPWLIRCARVSGHFVFVQGYTGANFYLATRYDLGQQNDAELWSRLFGPDTNDRYGQMVRNVRTPAEAVASDREAFRIGWQNIRANPRAYLSARAHAYPHLFLSSFDNFTGFNRSFAEATAGRDFALVAVKWGLLLVFSLLPFGLGVAGLCWTRRQPIALICACVWVSTLLVHLPLWIEYRFWQPVLPFLLVSAALGAYQLMQLAARQRRK